MVQAGGPVLPLTNPLESPRALPDGRIGLSDVFCLFYEPLLLPAPTDTSKHLVRCDRSEPFLTELILLSPAPELAVRAEFRTPVAPLKGEDWAVCRPVSPPCRNNVLMWLRSLRASLPAPFPAVLVCHCHKLVTAWHRSGR